MTTEQSLINQFGAMMTIDQVAKYFGYGNTTSFRNARTAGKYPIKFTRFGTPMTRTIEVAKFIDSQFEGECA